MQGSDAHYAFQDDDQCLDFEASGCIVCGFARDLMRVRWFRWRDDTLFDGGATLVAECTVIELGSDSLKEYVCDTFEEAVMDRTIFL